MLARTRRRAALQRNRARLVPALVGYLVLSAAVTMIQRTASLRAFFAGLAVTGLVWAVSLVVERLDGALAARGADAEELTSLELRRLRPR